MMRITFVMPEAAMPMDETLQIFGSIATAIVLEAAPFLALGSLLSAIVEVYVSPERLAHWVPRGLLPRVLAGVCAGFVLPTCECGVVPVARRLLTKGLPGPMVVAYLLSAPIVNPVVLLSTYVAFGSDASMVVGRVAVAVIVAGAVAFTVRGRGAAELVRPGADAHGHDHDHGAASSRPVEVLRHGASDFLEMGKYLILGACVAAAFKALVPPTFLAAFDGDQVLAVAGMMVLAIVLSVCSEADAFVAASFVTFPAAAKLAFITIGPMVDLKLLALYAVTFRSGLVARLVLLPIVLVFVLSLLYGGLG